MEVTYKEETINVDAVAQAVLSEFGNSRQLKQDPAIDWEDLKQEAWAVFLEKYQDFLQGQVSVESSFSGWAYTVMWSGVAELLRKSGPVHITKWALDKGESVTCWYPDEWTEEQGLSVWEKYTEAYAPAEHILELIDTQGLLLDKCLDMKCKMSAHLILERFGYLGPSEGLTLDELAERYDMSQSTVRRLIRKVLVKLRRDPDVKAEWHARTVR